MQYAYYPSLNNKTIFITGGASGIGAAMVERFLNQEAKIVIFDRDKDAAQALINKLDPEGLALAFCYIDLCDTVSLKQKFEQCVDKYGIDVLINNAANDQRHDPLSLSEKGWHDAMAINLDPVFFSAQLVIKHWLAEKKVGSIINLSSINARLGPIDMPAYNAAKAAILGLSKSLANQYGVNNIRVNTILPGWIATERQLASWLDAESEAAWEQLCALKGRIDPVEVANLALFLAADDSRKISGQEFVVDAGRL